VSSLRRLDDDFVSGVLWNRPHVRLGMVLLVGVLLGACAGGIAWPLLALGHSADDYSVVALPFMTIPAGAVLGFVVGVVQLRRTRRPTLFRR
jgi:hypothetical protein